MRCSFSLLFPQDTPMSQIQYTEDQIKSLDWREHMRMRPGMHISANWAMWLLPDDGIYVLLPGGDRQRYR